MDNNPEIQNIQWYPGHMTKTKRQISASLKLVDAVCEIIDARIPESSRNPDLTALLQSKPKVILMNKCDMADPAATTKWINYFKRQGVTAIAVDCKTGKGLNKLVPAVKDALADKIKAWQAKGLKNRSIRVMVVGIPNVGKSSFINRIAGKNRAQTADKPGVTRGNQWFTVSKGFELLDTPGVLWPKFEDKAVGERLSFIGSVNDQILDSQQLACRLIELLAELQPKEFFERLKITPQEISGMQSYEILSLAGKNRGMLLSGGEIDTQRAAVMLLDEFRAAKLGRITLELPAI